ncbi:MAG TPA: hypothetical protein DCF33_06395 [Saprospirales bacterium]|nr:hypothetical protein [Saprospirales bacterium]
MKEKILKTLTALILVILPFLVGTSIGKYSPYVETNSFTAYVAIWTVISMAFATIIFLFLRYFQLNRIGVLLFLLICPMVGIIGLAAPPDLSIKMLEHPEREHLRYIFLFIAAAIFGLLTLFLFKGNMLTIKGSGRWIITLIFVVAFAEFIWEFTHHYLYPEGLKLWISEGKNAEDFGKNYDNFSIISIGVMGRYVQFISIIWLSLHLYKLREIKIWSPILVGISGLLGIVSATVIYVTEMNIPKGFEFLFLFFIPGIPFLLLYWLGVALLTNFRKRDIIA